MSDPLSATASVAGLVSLGIQVVGGITKYLDAIRERKDDVALVKQQVVRTQDLLRLVATVAAKAELNHGTTAAFLKDSASVQPELQALDELVRKLDTTRLPRPNHEILGKVYVQAKKLTYPFHRPTVDRMQSRLLRVNDGLQAALQVTGLDVALDVERTTSAIKTTLPDLTRQLSDHIKQESLASRDAVARVGDSVVSLSGSIDQGLAKVLEGIATTSTASVSALNEDHAEKHSRLLQELSTTRNDVSGLSDTVKGIDMGIVKIQEDIATTSTASILLLRQDLAEYQATVLQELAVNRNSVTGLRDNFKRFDSGPRAFATREELGRLVSKPGQLKETCDIMEETTELTTFQNTSHRPRISLARRRCVCQKRVVRSRQALVWGPWHALADASTAHDHLPDCIYYCQDAVVSSKRLAVGFKGLQGLINRAIEVSFSYSFGAGGGSLSPGLNCYPTVDFRRDPAFRIMDLFNSATTREAGLSESDLAELLEQCLENLALLYRRGKASPKAVDQDGRGILHCIDRRSARAIHKYHLLNALDTLVKHGVQTALYDIDGATPAWNILMCLIPGPWVYGDRRTPDGPRDPSIWDSQSVLCDFLCVQEQCEPIVAGSVLYMSRVTMELFGVMLRAPATAEAFGCGPLSLAALKGDVKQMSLILANYPNAINELNLLEQTPLHLAIGHPSCIALLLRESGSKLIDLRDSGGRRPIDYALFSCLWSTMPRENQYHDGCWRNHGDTSLNIILDADCMLSPVATWPKGQYNGRSYLCDNCERAISAHLIDRREGLRRLAANNLPRRQANALGLFSPYFLDSNATRAIQVLKERGIDVPPSLQVDGLDRDNGIEVLPSPYHCDGPLPFSTLWSLGYRDLSSDFHGFTPLMQWASLFDIPWTGAGRCSWLIEQGADLWELAPNGITTIGHELYSTIGTLGDLPPGRQRMEDDSRRHFFYLTRKLSHRDPRDDCRCACSPGGCTPFVRFLQAARGSHHRNSVSKFIERLPQILDETHTSVRKDQMRSAVRYATFEMLGIRHTSCHAYGPRGQDEEMDEVRQEDCFLVALLEDLAAEFEVELEHMGRERYVNKRVSFWYGYWLPRMQQVQESIEGARIEEPEKAVAEEIGVVWHEHESEKGKDRDEDLEFDSDSYSDSEDGGHFDWGWESDVDTNMMFHTFRTMEDWTSRLDVIMSRAGLSAGR